MKYILKPLAKLMVWRCGPRVIAIIDGAEKSLAEKMIYAVLQNHHRTEKFENDWFWLCRRIFRGKNNCPEIIILECGAVQIDNVKYFLEIARPYVGVVMAADGASANRLIESLSSSSFAVLNFDNEAALKIKQKTRARVIGFGFDDKADLKISNFETRSENGESPSAFFKIEYSGSVVPFTIKDFSGKEQIYAVAAAVCVNLIFDLNLVEISEALSKNKE